MKNVLTISVFLILSTVSIARTSDELENAFQSNGLVYNVPVDLLKAIAYTETRFSHILPHENYSSCTDAPHVYGIMGLRNDDWFGHSLIEAANLIGYPKEMLIHDYQLNIQGAAALLSKIADEQNINRSDWNSWKSVIEKYSGIPQDDVKEFYSFDVFKVLSEGIELNQITIDVHPEIDMRQFSGNVNPSNKLKNIESDDYPPAVWDPSPNFYSNPPFYQKFSVVHTTQGGFAASVSWLKNPASSAATHYIIRSSDGYIVQLVREANAAWHAVCWNRWMFGTEHEGFVDNPAWYTDTMYLNSAALFRHLCLQYNIPMTRNYIIGHGEKSNSAWVTWMQQNFPSVDPNCNSHTDPGQYWDWNFYIQLITQDTLSPNVISNFPTGTDSVWSNTKIKIRFDQRMRKSQTQNAFSIQPSVPGTFGWEDLGKTLVFTPSTLLALGTQYTVTLDTSAMNFNYRPILGSHSFSFVTKTTSSLSVVESYPVNNQNNISASPKIIVKFDTPLLQSSIVGNVLLQDSASNNLSIKNLAYSETEGRGKITFSPLNNLIYDKLYKITVKEDIKNVVGSALGQNYSIDFRTETNNFVQGTLVDGFEAIAGWKTPSYSGSTVGVDPNKTTFTISSEEKISGNYSGKLTYLFTNASGGVCREFNSDKPSIGSDPVHRFGVWVYGDRSLNQLEFWFYYNTSTNSIVPIATLDWTGWKFIEIPISQIGGSGDRLFHSFVIKQTTNGSKYDSVYFDASQKRDPALTDIILVDNFLPTEFKLEQNYPNPFNPSTTIRYQVPKASIVSLRIYDLLGNEVAVLTNNEFREAGTYNTEFNTNELKLSSGVYFYQLNAVPSSSGGKSYVETRKMMVVK